MPVSKQLELTGAVILGVPQPTSGSFPGGEGTLPIAERRTVTESEGPRARTINSPGAFVDLLTGTGITNISFVYLRVNGGTLSVRYSSAEGADQEMTLSGLLLWSSAASAAAWTAIAVQGTADIEIMLAGT